MPSKWHGKHDRVEQELLVSVAVYITRKLLSEL